MPQIAKASIERVCWQSLPGHLLQGAVSQWYSHLSEHALYPSNAKMFLLMLSLLSPGEGCIALRLETTEAQHPIYTPLTHHGEMTGHFRGEIKLQTSQGKMREKLYGRSASPLLAFPEATALRTCSFSQQSYQVSMICAFRI